MQMYVSPFIRRWPCDLITLVVVYSTDGANTLASVIVLVLTWIKTFRQWNEARKMNLMLSISACLLRDGE